MLRVWMVSASCLLIASTSSAAEISQSNKEALASIFGESIGTDLKLNSWQKPGDKEHQIYMQYTVSEDSEFTDARAVDVAMGDTLSFCSAYVELLNQVVVDERPANVQIVHTEGDPKVTRYGFRHVLRWMSGKPITTPEERNPKTTVVATKTVQVNSLKIKNFGYAKHLEQVSKCENAWGTFKDDENRKFNAQRYVGLKARLRQLASSGGSTPATQGGTTNNRTAR